MELLTRSLSNSSHSDGKLLADGGLVMHSFVRTIVLATLLGVFLGTALSCPLAPTVPALSGFQNSQSKEPTGSISGRVTLGDKPAPRVAVHLSPYDYSPTVTHLPNTTTDDDGHFQLTNVAAGNYLLQTFTPALIAPSDDMRGRSGKIINLSEGEAVVGIEIALTRGGVITGRVTDAEGQPVIQENVRLTAVDERGQKQGVNLAYSFMQTTDDRGVYRLFGVAPGRYIVSVGVDPKFGNGRPGFGNSYSLTYYPDVSDDSKATVIEVSADGEAAGVDILLGRASKSYSATGRIVDDAGKPVSGVNSGYGSLRPDGDGFGSYYPNGTSNSKGEFRLEGLVPGNYAAFASSIEQSDWYSDPVPFQVTDADVSGIEVKVHRGSTLSGVMSFEGASDQEGVPKLSDLKLGIHAVSQTLTPPRSNQINIAPDGSFRAAGIQPGKVSLFLATYPPPKGVSVLRIEREGLDQSRGIEIGAGEQISGLRVVLGYGSGVIRGTVKVEGGALPPGSRLMVQCTRTEAGNNVRHYTQPISPDIRGRFAFEGLLPGNYELTTFTSTRQGAGTPSGRPRFARQTVSVTNTAETEVTLVIDLNENKQQ